MKVISYPPGSNGMGSTDSHLQTRPPLLHSISNSGSTGNATEHENATCFNGTHTCSSDGSGTGSSGSGGFSQRSKFARKVHVNIENAINGNYHQHHNHHHNHHHHHHNQHNHQNGHNHHQQQQHQQQQETISEHEETENDKMLNSYSCESEGEVTTTLSNGCGLGRDDCEDDGDDTCCSCSEEGSFLYEEPIQVK